MNDASLPPDDDLFAAFLRTVSHDLRSPLLTVSLANELLGEAESVEAEAAVTARALLTEGVRELDRMIGAITAISRARRRPLSAECIAVAGVPIVLDERILIELAGVLGSGPLEVSRNENGGRADLAYPLPGDGPPAGSPLRVLAGSLQAHAGTLVQDLAALEVQIERLGGNLRLATPHVLVELPVAPAPAD